MSAPRPGTQARAVEADHAAPSYPEPRCPPPRACAYLVTPVGQATTRSKRGRGSEPPGPAGTATRAVSRNRESRLRDGLPRPGRCRVTTGEEGSRVKVVDREQSRVVLFLLVQLPYCADGEAEVQGQEGTSGPPLSSTAGPSPGGRGAPSSTPSGDPGHADSSVDGRRGLSPTTDSQGARLLPQF